MLHACLVHPGANLKASLLERKGYINIEAMYEPLKLMCASYLLWALSLCHAQTVIRCMRTVFRD